MRSRRGTKRAAWQRRMVAKYKDVTWCEWAGCPNEGTDNAHRLKKTKITDEIEYIDGRAKLCRGHHLSLDEATGEYIHERMFLIIDKIMRDNGRIIITPDSIKMMEQIERMGYELID